MLHFNRRKVHRLLAVLVFQRVEIVLLVGSAEASPSAGGVVDARAGATARGGGAGRGRRPVLGRGLDSLLFLVEVA